MFCTKKSWQNCYTIHRLDFLNTIKLTPGTDFQNFIRKKIESFRYLVYYLKKDEKKKSVYVQISDFNKLSYQEKKHAAQPTHNVPGTFPEDLLKVLKSRTYLQGTNTKIDDLIKKLFFRSNSPCIRYLFLFL